MRDDKPHRQEALAGPPKSGVEAGELVQGVIKVWVVGTYKADVQLVGSRSEYLETVSVNRALADGDMTVGRTCLVAIMDPSNPDSAQVISVVA